MDSMRKRCLGHWRKRRTSLTVSLSIGASLALAAVLVGKWEELKLGITGAPVALMLLAIALQVVALVSRSEAWHASVLASGGSVGRRVLFRASSMAFLGNIL